MVRQQGLREGMQFLLHLEGTFCEKGKKKYFSPVLDFPYFINTQPPGRALALQRGWGGSLLLYYKMEQLLPENLLEAAQPQNQKNRCSGLPGCSVVRASLLR